MADLRARMAEEVATVSDLKSLFESALAAIEERDRLTAEQLDRDDQIAAALGGFRVRLEQILDDPPALGPVRRKMILNRIDELAAELLTPTTKDTP